MDFPKIMEYREGVNFCIIIILRDSTGFEICGNVNHTLPHFSNTWNLNVFRELELKKCE